MLERVTDEPIRQVVTRLILEPLGMDRTTFDIDDARRLGLAQGYARFREGSAPPDRNAPVEMVEPVSEKNGIPVVFTTVRDVIGLLATMGEGRLAAEAPFGQTRLGLSGNGTRVAFRKSRDSVPGAVSFRLWEGGQMTAGPT